MTRSGAVARSGTTTRRATTRPRLWALVSSAAAPVFLIGGWSWAQAVQPAGYDAVHDTISALARSGLPHRWIMTTGLAGLGVCHVLTAAGLRGVAGGSRAVLAAAGLGTIGVAASPLPFEGSSSAHVAFATVAFVLLVAWPATTSRRRAGAPVVVRPAVAVTVSVVSAALLAWFVLIPDGGPDGLAERVLAAQQAIWPLVVVVALRHAGRHTADGTGS